VLCHGLCHNPAIPERVGASAAVSLSHTQKAVNVHETRMNTASLCRSASLRIGQLQFTPGNGMEEVIGSIPIRSTNYFNPLAPPPFRNFVANSRTTPRTGFRSISDGTETAILPKSSGGSRTRRGMAAAEPSSYSRIPVPLHGPAQPTIHSCGCTRGYQAPSFHIDRRQLT
jgi:hypothetical protein